MSRWALRTCPCEGMSASQGYAHVVRPTGFRNKSGGRIDPKIVLKKDLSGA